MLVNLLDKITTKSIFLFLCSQERVSNFDNNFKALNCFGMAAEKTDSSFVRILISYKEYERLKNIESQFKKSEEKFQEKLQLAGI